jgi:hypothetical protein
LAVRHGQLKTLFWRDYSWLGQYTIARRCGPVANCYELSPARQTGVTPSAYSISIGTT